MSNDNAYAESLFRTCKYRPNYPGKPFESIEQARQWTLSSELASERATRETHRELGGRFVDEQRSAKVATKEPVNKLHKPEQVRGRSDKEPER